MRREREYIAMSFSAPLSSPPRTNNYENAVVVKTIDNDPDSNPVEVPLEYMVFDWK